MTANFHNNPRAQPFVASRLMHAFNHWANLAADDLGFQQRSPHAVRAFVVWHATNSRAARVVAGGCETWMRFPDACIWATLIDDESTRPIAVTMTHAVAVTADVAALLCNDLAVAADQLLACGDERGEWLARWLMPDGPQRAAALAECGPAIVQAMAGLVARRLPSAVPDYTTLEQRVAAMYNRVIYSSNDAAIAHAATMHEDDFFDRLKAAMAPRTPKLTNAALYAATALTIAAEPPRPTSRARVSADVLRLLASEAQR